MDTWELGDGTPSKFTLIMRWLFDNTLLPFMERFFPCDHPDDPAPYEAEEER